MSDHGPHTSEGVAPGQPVLAVRWRAAATLAATTLVGLAAFLWPFLAKPGSGLAHSSDAPWLFVLLIALLTALVMAELSGGGLDAKTVAVLGVLAAAGGALRVLGAGTAGLEPMFFLVVVAGRVLGRGMGFVLGALAVLVGAFLTGGVGPWAPFQMIAAGWVGFGAGCLPRAGGRPERLVLAGYGLVASLLYGVVMNLWFWPFVTTGVPAGLGFVPGEAVSANLSHYAAFYLATSLGWDLPRGVLTAVLVIVAGRPVLASLRRGTRRAAFGATGQFVAGQQLSQDPSDDCLIGEARYNDVESTRTMTGQGRHKDKYPQSRIALNGVSPTRLSGWLAVARQCRLWCATRRPTDDGSADVGEE